MRHKFLGWVALAFLMVAAIPFWLWKLYIITGPSVHILVRLFVSLFGLSLIFGFAFGCRGVFQLTQNWVRRGLLIVILLVGEAYVALMAALAMNFAGQ